MSRGRLLHILQQSGKILRFYIISRLCLQNFAMADKTFCLQPKKMYYN